MHPILLFGGMSDERLVAVASAQNVLATVPAFTPWFIAPDGAVSEVAPAEIAAHEKPFEVQFVAKTKPFAPAIEDAVQMIQGRPVFICLHGDEGENGTIQKTFENAGVHYTGSDSKSSAACFDKLEAKRIVSSRGVAVAEQVVLTERHTATIQSELTNFARKHGKIVVKPIASGSSVGLHIVDATGDLAGVARAVAASGHLYMAEMFLEGREITVGVVQHAGTIEALCASEVLVQKGRSFDYNGKYLGQGITEVTPAELAPKDEFACLALALDAHRRLRCYGYSRTDIILTEKGPFFLETNTLPGLSKSSFVPQQLAARHLGLSEFIAGQLELATKR